MWTGVWLLYYFFIDRLLASDIDVGERMNSSSERRFTPFQLEIGDDEMDGLSRTTTSIPRIALKDWMEKNPNLKKLAMFGIENKIESDLELELEEDEKREAEMRESPHAEDDNFHHMYIEMNRTFFAQTDIHDEERMSLISMSTPRRRIATGGKEYDKRNELPDDPLLNDNTQFPTSTESNPSSSSLSSTPRPPYYRIPDMLGLQRDSLSSRVEGEATLSFPPRDYPPFNEVMEDGEELPFIGDSTTFEIPTAPSPTSSSSPSTFSFTSSPTESESDESIFSFRNPYFGTTEPSVDPPNLEHLHKGSDREELVLFNSREGSPMEGMLMKWSRLPSNLLPRREETTHSGGMKRVQKKRRKKKTKKIERGNYALSLNSQRATSFEMDEDEQLRRDLERELRLLNEEKEGTKLLTKGRKNEKVKGVSKSWGRSGKRGKHIEMEKNPMFAMEIEIVRTKKLRDEMDGNSEYINEKRKHKKYGKTSSNRGIKPIAPLSQARMVSRGDRMIEQRVSMIGGHKVTVDLANPALHGADLMMNPGAILHDLLDRNPKTDERREKERPSIVWRGREESGENESPTWNNIYSKTSTVEVADPQHRVITNIDDSSRIEIETFDGSQFDRPSKCCEENEIVRHSSKGEVENLESLFIPLNSDISRRTQSASLYGLVNDLTRRGNEKDTERYVMEKCFEEKRNCYLIYASPMERRIGLSAIECLRFCSRVKGCLSVSFASTLSICDIYNIRNGTGTANLVQLLGYVYFEPKVTEIEKCISAHSVKLRQEGRKNIRRSQSKRRKQIHTTTQPIDLMRGVNEKRGELNLTMATRARCQSGEDSLFIRSRGIRDEGGSNLDTVLNINEDDCIFSCISNLAGYYDIFNCVSAQYDSFDEACILSSDSPNDSSLSLHSSSTFYEKMCTNVPVSSQCSGGTIERKRQKILTGLLRDSISVGSARECIERCIDVALHLPFKCLSVVYYYEEATFNCVLNDGSSHTHPDSLFDETNAVVDYFGVDECHGIREITRRISDKDNDLRSMVHDGGLIHKRAERPLPRYEQARI